MKRSIGEPKGEEVGTMRVLIRFSAVDVRCC